jgi:hypothetical protein
MVHTNKKCTIDKDCDENNICAFNDKEFAHYCIDKEVNNLYYGCLNINNVNKLQYIDSNAEMDHADYLNCINFSRRQVNEDGIEYNYMIYKPKKPTYVDLTTINIYLKCGEEVLLVIPYDDYFITKCDNYREKCTLESKKSLMNFIEQNSKNCTDKNNLHLEVIYLCENEGINKKLKIPIDIKSNNLIKIDLSCPISVNNDKLQSKCKALYLNKYKTNNEITSLINTNIQLKNCDNPIYEVPRIVKNVDSYKKVYDKEKNKEIQEYDKEIDTKINDLKRIKAEKYIKLKKNQDGTEMSMEDALREIDKMPSDKLINSGKNNWKFYENYDAAQKLFTKNDNNNENPNLKYYGRVYTLDDAVKIANELNENFFVWYHNSFELDNYASKLYFINIYNLNKEQLNKDNWTVYENVTTAMFKLDLENFTDENFDSTSDLNSTISTLNSNVSTISDRANGLYTLQLSEQNINKELYNSINKNLDNKITTYGQAISMNQYETNINNNILKILISLLIFMVIMFIFVYTYYNTSYGDKFRLIMKK